MDRLAVFLAAVTPALALLGYGVAKARGSWRNDALWNAFFAGALCALAAVVCEAVLDSVLPLDTLSPALGAVASALLIAAIPEETLKFVVLVFFAERDANAKRRQDLIMLSLGVALGFAAIENLGYLAVPGDWRSVAVVRATTAVPGHGIDGLAMGALLTAARLGAGQRLLRLALAWALPVALHWAYDVPPLLLRSEEAGRWLGALWLIVISVSAVLAIFLCNRILPAAAAADQASGSDRRPPAAAGSLIVGGAALIVAGPLLGILLYVLEPGELPWSRSTLVVLPLLLGADLLNTGLRRRGIAAWSWALARMPKRP